MKKMTLGFKLVFGGIIAVLIPLTIVGIFTSIKATNARILLSSKPQKLQRALPI